MESLLSSFSIIFKFNFFNLFYFYIYHVKSNDIVIIIIFPFIQIDVLFQVNLLEL